MQVQRERFNPDKVINNTFYNAVGNVWRGLVAFLLTPYIISKIGMERFGVWAIVGALTGYFGLFDFGVSASFSKYIAEFYAKQEYDKINNLVNTSVTFYAIFAAAIITLTYFFINHILSIFKIPIYLYNETVFVFRIGVILFGLSGILSVFGAVQAGMQRMDVTNKIIIFISVINIFGTLFFLEQGYGLSGLMINNAICFVASSIINIEVAHKIFSKLQFKLFVFNREMFRKLFNYGYKVQVLKTAELILSQTDRLLIAYFFNMNFVGVYQLGALLIRQIRLVPMLLISALLPAASEIHAKQAEKTKKLYIRVSKYLNFVSFPLLFFVAAAAPIIMQIWIGPGHEQSALIVRILSLGYLASTITSVGWIISLARGNPEIGMRTAIIVAVSAIFMSIVLILTIGFTGPAFATTIALILGGVYFLIKLHKHMGMSSKLFFKAVILPPIVGSVIAVILPCILNYISPVRLYSFKCGSYAILAFEAALFFAVYFIIVTKVKYIDDYDIWVFRNYIYNTPFFNILIKVKGANIADSKTTNSLK